jgi:hypothetical protein
MKTTHLIRGIVATVLLLAGGVRDACATTITITASVSDRGIDVFPWDGVDAGVFNNPSVVQITTPPIDAMFASEERTGVEFPLATIPIAGVINAVTLRLDPQGSGNNIGLAAGGIGEINGYAGDGAIQVADLMDSLLVGSIVGPTPNGALLIPLSSNWLQTLVDGGSPYAGLMFKGVPGPAGITYNFDAAFALVPVGERPTLIVDVEDSAVVPEPGTLVLSGTALTLAALRRRRRRSFEPPVHARAIAIPAAGWCRWRPKRHWNFASNDVSERECTKTSI